MSTAIIITICLLLLFAYLFDVSSSRTKIPSVILLLILGWSVKQGAILFEISIPNLIPILPILGTIGLILIVLEGSLELELNKSKLNILRNSYGLSSLRDEVKKHKITGVTDADVDELFALYW